MKKLFAVLMTLMLSISVLGCDENTTDTKTSLTFLGWGSPDEKRAYDSIISMYEANNENVSVRYIIVPPQEYAVKLQNMLNSSTPPDVFYLPGDSVVRYVLTGQVLNLTPLLAETDYVDLDNVWENGGWNPYRFNVDTLERGKPEDDIYALPKDIGPFAMFYNKEMFENFGVREVDPENPWTWDEFLVEMEKISRDVNNDGVNDVFGLANFDPFWHIASNEASFLSEDAKTVTIDTPEFKESLQFLVDLIKTHEVMLSPTQMSGLNALQLFTSQKAAIYGTGPWSVMGFKQLAFEWDVMPIPINPDTGKSGTWRGSMGLAVSAESQYIEHAFELALYLAFNEEGQRSLYEMGQTMPNLIDMAKGEYLTSDSAQPDNREEFIRIIESDSYITISSPAEMTYDREWYEVFYSNWTRVLNGEETVDEYIARIKPIMQSFLDSSWDKVEGME